MTNVDHLGRWILLWSVLGAGCSAPPGAVTAQPIALPARPIPLAGIAAVTSCRSLDSYTAALAHATIACTGELGPDSFHVDDEGFLSRGFQTCSNPDQALDDVDYVLGLQHVIPGARACFAEQWTAAVDRFFARGNSTCPAWREVGAEGSPTPPAVSQLAERLPRIERVRPGERPKKIGEQNSLYRVSFAGESPAEACGSAADCAEECAAGLPGFVVERRGDVVVGDPLWWHLGTIYPPGQDPFLMNGYYHPMSYYGLLPGELFAHPNRAGEPCSYWNGVYHELALLVYGCIVPETQVGCYSLCTPPENM